MSAESVLVEGVPGKALVGVTDVEVLLSEKTSEEIKCKFGLTEDKLKHPQWLECYITPLPQCITTLCIVSCGQRITRATNTDMCLYHVRTTWKVYHSIQ